MPRTPPARWRFSWKDGSVMDETSIREQLARAVRDVRATNPLAGSVTNNVTIDFVANAQLAVGGSAAMVYLPDEAEDLGLAGGAFYMNMGTLTSVLGETMPHAARVLHQAGKPWVLDPVGLGIGSLRTQILNELKPCKPSVVRGNASEIIGLAGLWGLDGDAAKVARIRGVDSTDTVDAATSAAVALARYTGGAVAVSGEADLVTDGTVIALSRGGSAMMSMITGCGCSLGGVISVYCCAASPFVAALAGAVVYNVAGKRAAAAADAPGSFKVAFIDELYRATPEDVAGGEIEFKEA